GAPIERSVNAARAYLDARVGQRVPLARLGKAVGLSPWHVQRAFTRLVGVSPKAYQEARQREQYKDQLRSGAVVGRQAYGREATEIGMRPGSYRRGGRGVTIRYAVVPSDLGFLLVGMTDRGDGTRDRGIDRERQRPVGAPAGSARHGVPDARLGRAARDPGWDHAYVYADRRADREPEGRARRRRRVCVESRGHRCPLPPRGAQRSPDGRLQVGRGAQEPFAGEGGQRWLGSLRPGAPVRGIVRIRGRR